MKKILLLAVVILSVCACSCMLEPEDKIHSWGNGIVVQEANCIQEGIKEYTCVFCNKVKTVISPSNADLHEFTKTIWSSELGDCKGCERCNAIVNVFNLNQGMRRSSGVDTQATTLYILGDVTNLNKDATSKFEELETIVLPFSIEEINANAFSKNPNMTFINYEGTMEQWRSILTQDGWRNGTNITYVQCSDGRIYFDQVSHNPIETKARKETCTEDGNTLYYYCNCSDCNGKYFEDENCTKPTTLDAVKIKALGHDMVLDSVIKEANCIGEGKKLYKCNHEGCTYTKEETIALNPNNHATNLTHVEKKNSTCTEDGNLEYYYCSSCNKYYSDNLGTTEVAQDSLIISKTGHTEVSDDVGTATCTEAGTTARVYCSVCNVTLKEPQTSGTPLGHDFKTLVSTDKAATCSSTGLATYKCIRCETTEQRIIPIDENAHNYVSLAKVEATCTTNGNEAGQKCTLCNDIKGYSTIVATGHKWTTKHNENEHWQECSVCHTTKNEASHTYNDGVVQTAASCLTSGSKLCTCTYPSCGQTKVVEIKANGSHSLTLVNAVAATCTNAGVKEHYHCSVCGKDFTDGSGTTEMTDTVATALGHSLEHVTRKEATCTATGNIEYWHCSRCNKNFASSSATSTISDVTIKKKAHTEEVLSAKAATCTETGLTAGKKCSVCGTVTAEQNTIAALGHALGTYQYDVDNHWKECTRDGCDYIKTEDHSLVNNVCYCGYVETAKPNTMIDLSSIEGAPSLMVSNTEVTYELWYEVRTWAEEHGYSFTNLGREGNDGEKGAAPTSAKNEPVTSVSWYDCIVWCNAYSEMQSTEAEPITPVYDNNGTIIKTTTGLTSNSISMSSTANGYRLPTVAEWETVAKAGTKYQYIGTNEYSKIIDYAWISANSGNVTHDVATKEANNWGIYDMSGNVQEWCWDKGKQRGNYILNDRGSSIATYGGNASVTTIYTTLGLRVVRTV